MRRPSKKLVVLTLGAFAASGAVAFAAWSTNGAGQATATAGTAAAVTMTAAAPSTSLYPDASAGVATTIGNPNAFPVHVSSIALDASQGTNGFSVDAAHSGCDLSTLSFTAQANGGAGWDVAPQGTLAVELADAIAMSGAAVDACQGATFTVHLLATAASA